MKTSKQNSILLIGGAIVATIALLRHKKQTSGVGAVKRRIYAELAAAQDAGVNLDGGYNDRNAQTLERLGKRFGFRQSARSTKPYAESYYNQLRRAYNAVAGIGATTLPYSEYNVRNSNGDVIVTYRDYGSEKQQMADAINWVHDERDIVNNDYDQGYWGTLAYIAGGGRLIWTSKHDHRRGIKELIFGDNSDSERKARISYIGSEAKGAISPEQLAHRIWESYDAKGDDQEIADGVYYAIRSVTSKGEAQNYIMNLYIKRHAVEDYSDPDLPF